MASPSMLERSPLTPHLCHHWHETVKWGADRTDEAVLVEARRRKERTFPELAGVGGRATLVVLAAEVGGRWSQEYRQFLLSLASVEALSAPYLLQSKAKAGWLQWSCLLGCTAAKSFAVSLMDGSAARVGGSTQSVHDVLGEHRYAPGLQVHVTALL